MRTLYLSGAITHNPDYKQDFEKAYKDLTDAGYTVVSPLDICGDWGWNMCMRRCIEVLVTRAIRLRLSQRCSIQREWSLKSILPSGWV